MTHQSLPSFVALQPKGMQKHTCSERENAE